MLKVAVSVSELYALAKEMRDDGMDYVFVSIMEEDPKNDFPLCLHFEASTLDPSSGMTDYEFLDDISSTL